MALALPLPWQDGPWRTVQDAATRRALTHAWLLSGARGVGKRSFAAAWMASLLCQARTADGHACGGCTSCKLLASGGHPDAHLLCLDGHLGAGAPTPLQRDKAISHWQPDAQSARTRIVVDAVRSLLHKLSLAPHLGGARVVVISPADLLNDAAANALLKTVEEPIPGTYVLLLSESPNSLKQTLRSRCQQLRFAIPEAKAAMRWLREQAPHAEEAVLQLAGGAPLQALEWLKSGEVSRRAGWTKDLDDVLQQSKDALAVAAEWAKDKALVPQQLRHWQGLLAQQLREGAGWGVWEERFLALLIEQTRAVEFGNANAQLALESLFLRWRQR